MKKVYLTAVGFALICRFSSYAQTRPYSITKPAFSLYQPVAADTTGYNTRRLKIDEINIVSSYYDQDGQHSAITGGIGTQKVMDVSNTLDVKLVWLGQSLNKNTLSLGLGVDHHTSASSAYVTLSGMGKPDGTRIYPSLDYTHESNNQGTSFGLGAYYSGEYNYKSIGADIHFSAKTKDKSGEFTARAQAYLDKVTLIYPAELISVLGPPAPPGATYVTTASGNRVLSTSAGGPTSSKPGLASSPRDTYTASLSYLQIINSRLQVMLLGDVVVQNGLLSLPYHRVYFSNGRDTIERLPTNRFKLPIGARLNYFWGDNIILRSYYRYYADNWGSRSNTAGLEVAYKISPFFSLSPFYRYYDQTASKYFEPYKTNSPTAQYFTSNYEYAKFNSSFYGLGIRLSPPKGVAGWQRLRELELRYGHYKQTTNLASDVVSLSMGFK